MDESLPENLRKSPAPTPTTPASVPPAEFPHQNIVSGSSGQRGIGTKGSQSARIDRGSRISAALLEAQVPSRQRGRTSRYAAPLPIPQIPQTPSNTTDYVFKTPQNPPTPLLPSAALPSPLTPSFLTASGIPLSESFSDTQFLSTRAIETSSDPLPEISYPRFQPMESSRPKSPVHNWMHHINPNFQHSLPSLRPPRMSESQRLERAIEVIVDELHYSSVAHFFAAYVQQIPRGSSATFSNSHRNTLKAFLQGQTQVKPVDIVDMLYCHRYSNPSYRSNQRDERDLAFDPYTSPSSINYAKSSISAWATQLVGKQVSKSMKDLTHDPPKPDEFSAQVPVRLVAAANDRTKGKGVRMVTKEDLMSFRLADRAKLFKARAPLVWYLTECMAAKKKNGILIARKRRNPSIVSFASSS